MEILKVENLTKVYGKGENEVRALNGVSFSVEKGDFVAIIGPSGSGKSTLLHTLGGVDRPTGGKVLVNGQDVYSRSDEQIAVFRRREVGLIYQFYNLIPVLNVEENMSLPVLLDGRNVNRDRLRELIRELDLVGREKHLPNQLSGGQQQRVSIGRALMNSPSIVLADEPTGAVDTKTTAQIMNLFHMVNADFGVTTVIVTHDRQLSHMVPRVVTISDGRIGTEFIRREEIDMESDEIMDATAGHDQGSHVEYGFIDGRKRLFLPENYLAAVGLKEKSKVCIQIDADKLILSKPEEED